MFLPEITRQPEFHNPFPQLTNLAVPLFLQSQHRERSMDVSLRWAISMSCKAFQLRGSAGRHCRAENEGLRHHAGDAGGGSRLAQLLEVDAVVVGAVTDLPLLSAANRDAGGMVGSEPEVPSNPAWLRLAVGYAGEEDIPPPLIFQARMALAREQMKTQEPAYKAVVPTPPLTLEGLAPPVGLPPAEDVTKGQHGN